MSCTQPTVSCSGRDLVASRAALWLWGLPGVLLLVGMVWEDVRGPLWVVAFLVGGVACVANAARCGRTHCYLTGPLYLGLSMMSALISLHVLPWSWWWVGAAGVVGTVVAYVPEFVGRRYVTA